MRRLVLALLPVAGFALGLIVTRLVEPAAAGAPPVLGGGLLAVVVAVAGCLALGAAAAVLAVPPGGGSRRPARRGPAIPRSTRPPAARDEPPTVSGFWRALDEPDWPEGEVRRERLREEEPVAAAR